MTGAFVEAEKSKGLTKPYATLHLGVKDGANANLQSYC